MKIPFTFTRRLGRTDWLKVSALAASMALIAVLHFTVSTQTHSLHVVHVFLGAVTIIPILAAAVWFGLAGGVLSATVLAIIYFIHMRLDWAGQPMENINQVAMMTVYLTVGIAAGVLEHLQERERGLRQTAARRAQRETIIQGLASLDAALGSRDEATLKHSENVAWLSHKLGLRMGLSEARLDVLRLAALVHDIGKIGIRDDILLKPEKLSPAEIEQMHRHPAVAADILRTIHGTEEIAEIVLCHHERLDGTGYPRRLKASSIPFEAKILSVADVYCALTEERLYNLGRRLNSAQALNLMWESAGLAFEPTALTALQEFLGESPPVSMLVPSRGGLVSQYR